MDIARGTDGIAKVLYEIRDGKLWFAWLEKSDERPKNFDAVADRDITLRIFKKIEKPRK